MNIFYVFKSSILSPLTYGGFNRNEYKKEEEIFSSSFYSNSINTFRTLSQSFATVGLDTFNFSAISSSV